MLSWHLVIATSGCGPVVAEPGVADTGTTTDASDPTTSSTSTGDSTTGNTTTTTTSTSTTDASGPSTIADESEASTAAWPGLPDFLVHGCDVWEQDCRAGQKCVAFGFDEENAWDYTHCWQVADTPGQLGDPCTVEQSWFAGFDDCDFGLMCYFVDPDTLMGTCVAQCEGSESDPICSPPNTACLITNGAPLAICLPECDPLAPACGEGETCSSAEFEFVCLPQAGDGAAYGEPCEYINDCDPGLTCILGEAAVGCDASGCCSWFCDLTIEDPDLACPQYDLGERCIPLFEDAPPEHADVGLCAIPPR